MLRAWVLEGSLKIGFPLGSTKAHSYDIPEELMESLEFEWEEVKRWHFLPA